VRTLSGQAFNCDKTLLGRVAIAETKHNYKYDAILVAKNQAVKKSYKYLATVTNSKQLNPKETPNNIPTFFNVDRIEELNTGDVIRLNPNGTIDVLFEINSPHNILFVTEQCNSSCLICPQHTTKSKSDYTDLALNLIKLVAPSTGTLAITGGEPTLLQDNFFRIIQACKETLPLTALNVLSNGIKFSDFDFTKRFALLAHPNIRVAIPLYADTDTGHNNIAQTNSFYKTVKGIQNLALFGQNIEIRTVITALNYQRLPQFAEFIYRNFPFVQHIAFMGMETRELVVKNLDQVWIDPYEYKQYLEDAVGILSLRNMNVSIYNHQLCILPKVLWKYACKSISLWKNIYIDECSSCVQKQLCGGFFASCQNIHSKYIHAL
jgi:His-Xaa-Ser system radical SAM maturase HxsC